MADPLSLVPSGDKYNNLRAALTVLKQDFPDQYQAVAGRVQGWVDRIDSGSRTDDQTRDDIFQYVIGVDAIMEQYAISREQAEKVILGKNEGGLDIREVRSGAAGAAQPESLPRGAKLAKVGNSYRVVWELGGGLGWAWYTISGDQLKNIYDTKTPDAHFTLSNKGQFEARFGNNYWGNVAEVDLKAETPWQDLKGRIFNQFGWVPGFDDPQIRRLMVQGYFEGWDQNQWIVQYRQTDYFKNTTDAQRQWSGLSKAEKDQRIQNQAVELANQYESIWGRSISLNDSDIRDMALKIASGQSTLDQWVFNQRQAAAKEEGTPEERRRREEEEAQRAEGNEIENLTNFAADQWRAWVGPVNMPKNFAEKWGADLASGKASEADLESYLKQISSGRWKHKPPDLTWEDWAASYKGEIRETLELGGLDDNDPLLKQVLTSDLEAMDLQQLIRGDGRFRQTRRMYGELSSQVEDMGRRFGFIT